MSEIITDLEKESARQLAQAIHSALVHEGYVQYAIFATNGKNGFFLGYPPNFADQGYLKMQIVRNLKERPELLAFFKEIVSQL